MGRNGGVGNGGAFDAMMLRMARDGRLSELEEMQCFQWEVLKLCSNNITLIRLIKFWFFFALNMKKISIFR